MTALTLLEGALILLTGMGIGRFWPARRRGPKPKPPARALCGCKHEASYHDPKTSHCHASVYRAGGYYVTCTCRQYTGPVPLPEYYAPEISP